MHQKKCNTARGRRSQDFFTSAYKSNIGCFSSSVKAGVSDLKIKYHNVHPVKTHLVLMCMLCVLPLYHLSFYIQCHLVLCSQLQKKKFPQSIIRGIDIKSIYLDRINFDHRSWYYHNIIIEINMYTI